MTLQLEVGKTYRARNGDVVEIVDRSAHNAFPLVGNDGISYAEDGRYALNDVRNEFDLIEEISSTPELDVAIAKFEREWGEAKTAMDRARWAAEGVIRAAKRLRE